MGTKEYLKQAFYLDKRIQTKTQELFQLRKTAGLLQAVNYDRPIVQGGTAGSGMDGVDKIISLEQEINREIDALLNLKQEIRQRIEKLENADFRDVLTRRYILFETWEQIAVDMHYTYRWIHKLHGRALSEFEKST